MPLDIIIAELIKQFGIVFVISNDHLLYSTFLESELLFETIFQHWLKKNDVSSLFKSFVSRANEFPLVLIVKIGETPDAKDAIILFQGLFEVLNHNESAGYGGGFQNFFVGQRGDEPYLPEERFGLVLSFNTRVPRYPLFELRMIRRKIEV